MTSNEVIDDARLRPSEDDERPDNGITLLDDEDLVRTEVLLGREYLRLELLQPHRRDTTFRVLQGSAGLLHAWTRWHEARIALTARGLVTGLSSPRRAKQDG